MRRENDMPVDFMSDKIYKVDYTAQNGLVLEQDSEFM